MHYHVTLNNAASSAMFYLHSSQTKAPRAKQAVGNDRRHELSSQVLRKEKGEEMTMI